jgi:hypothetical protein
MKTKKHKSLTLLGYFSRCFSIVVGLVLIWRGVWYVLDYFDLIFFDNNHLPLAIGGIILGLFILYIPDKDLKEIDKL